MYETESLISFQKNELYDQLFQSIDKRFGCESSDYTKFQDDPIGFGEQIFGDRYTPDVKDLMLSVRDNPVTIAVSGNATGKTHAAARIGTWWYKCFPDSQVYTAAAPPESNLKKLLWGEIGGVIERFPDRFKSDNLTSLHVERSSKSFLTGVTIPSSGTEAQREAKFSGKHAPHLLFILDEGDAVPDEIFKGIESCMSGGHCRLLVMFNPRAEAGAAYRMIRDGRVNVVRLSALNHPNVTTGENEIPGAVDRDTTVRRINEWCRPLAEGEQIDGECFKLPGFLEGVVGISQGSQKYPPLKPGYYKIIEPAFSYMVLGEYPSRGNKQLISREWIAQARSRFDLYVSEHGEVPPSQAYGTMGLDVAEFGTDANVCCFRYGCFIERLVAWSGIDVLSTADKAAVEYKERNLITCNVDATGLGAGVAPAMQRQGCSASGIKVASSPTERSELGEFGILRDQLWWACREWLRTDTGAMLPPDELLIEELQTPTYEVINGKIKIMKKDTMKELLRRSPDRADALILTFAKGGLFANNDLT